MNVFKDNTLANFKNLLSEEINLQGEWRVAVTEITFPTQINNVTDNNIVYYKKDRVIASMKVEKDKISRPYLGETAKLTKGEYTSIDQILDEIRRKDRIREIGLRNRSNNQTSFLMAALLGRYNFFKPANS